jgi:hypothetical protein
VKRAWGAVPREDFERLARHQYLDLLVEGALASKTRHFDRPTEDHEEELERRFETIALRWWWSSNSR